VGSKLENVPQQLMRMDPERANRVFMHPIHQDAYRDLIDLITTLRQSRTFEDYYHFQQDLLGRVLAVQQHRSDCTRVAALLRKGKGVPASAPDLRSGADASDPECWVLEADVCERVQRQLRSLADALAWRVFNYERRVIVALSRNDPSGPMAGKHGLAAERAFLTQWWDSERSFVLLHDLTTCLRISDATLFRSVGREFEAYLHEIKTTPGKERKPQRDRQQLAEEAIRSAGPLPGDPDMQLVAVDVAYKTHLTMLRDAFDKTVVRGVVGMKVPSGRALVAASMARGYDLWPEDEFVARTGSAHDAACKRAGIIGRGDLVTFYSNDIVGLSPTAPPWAIYPLHPNVCASLIVDMAAFFVTTSGQGLVEAVRERGLNARWLVEPGLQELQPDQEVMRIDNSVRITGMRAAELGRIALELTHIPTWTAGVKALLAREDLHERRPWHYFADEYKTWA
jgi:hypothetical protein